MGNDGAVVLWLVEHQQPNLKTLPTVKALWQAWERHFVRSEIRGREWRADADLPRAASALESPYDVEARHSSKREIIWTGYKAHLTETCDTQMPRLITHVHTTPATVQDVSCTADIQQALAEKGLLPQRHFVDTGYLDAELLVSSREQHGIDLFGPPRAAHSWQAREGGYDHSCFSMDWEKQQATCPEGKATCPEGKATCPEGKASRSWATYQRKPDAHSPKNRFVVMVRFAPQDCLSCASRPKCVRSPSGQSRALLFPERSLTEALEEARGKLSRAAGRAEYRLRAGVEGSISQGVRRSGLRRTRYRGLSKTHLFPVVAQFSCIIYLAYVCCSREGIKAEKSRAFPPSWKTKASFVQSGSIFA